MSKNATDGKALQHKHRRRLGQKLIERMADFLADIKAGETFEAHKVTRYQTPDGPMNVVTESWFPIITNAEMQAAAKKFREIEKRVDEKMKRSAR